MSPRFNSLSDVASYTAELLGRILGRTATHRRRSFLITTFQHGDQGFHVRIDISTKPIPAYQVSQIDGQIESLPVI